MPFRGFNSKRATPHYGIRALFQTLPALFMAGACVAQSALSPSPVPQYEFRKNHDPNGIGKFYLGREIALVMGHQAADWLERPEREAEEQPTKLLKALRLKPGQAVADIGAGTGYYSRRMAGLVGNQGLVYAVDIQQEMLDLLTNKMAELKISNIKPILGTIVDPKLPDVSVDLILMVDVYHEFDHPYEMVAAMCRALKPGGRLVFVEFRGEDPEVPIKPVHKMTESQVRKEMAAHPLDWVETLDVLPRQHIIFFARKPSDERPAESR
jgi:SAM-dependent methyltransferase